MANVGDRKTCRLPKSLREKGVRIDRIVSRLAYARNGNTHNPTPEYYWLVYLDNRQIGQSYRWCYALDIAAEATGTDLEA